MALNADVAQMLSAAGQLKNIQSEVLSSLARYQTMNQNLHGAGFDGDASLASLNSVEQIRHTGQQVSTRFENTIHMMERAAQQYAHTNDQNRAALGNVQTT